MAFVFDCVRTGDEDIIYVDEHEVEASCNFVHESLESLSRVTETKRHFCELKKAKWSRDSCFADIVFGDWNLVVRPNQINLGEDGATVEMSGENLYVGY